MALASKTKKQEEKEKSMAASEAGEEVGIACLHKIAHHPSSLKEESERLMNMEGFFRGN